MSVDSSKTDLDFKLENLDRFRTAPNRLNDDQVLMVGGAVMAAVALCATLYAVWVEYVCSSFTIVNHLVFPTLAGGLTATAECALLAALMALGKKFEKDDIKKQKALEIEMNDLKPKGK